MSELLQLAKVRCSFVNSYGKTDGSNLGEMCSDFDAWFQPLDQVATLHLKFDKCAHLERELNK